VVALEDIWREHKRFILAVGIGTAVYFTGLSWVWATDRQTALFVRQARETEAEIRALSDGLAGREGFEEGVGLALENEVAPAIRDAVEFRSRPEFALKEGDSPFIVYRRAIEQVEAARTEGKRRNMTLPEDFGFEKDPPEERVRVHIAGADLVERVLAALVATGFRSVETLRVGSAEYVRTVEEAEKRAPTGDPVLDGVPEKPAAEPPVLRRLPVRVAASGPLDAVELFLSGFQRAGSLLEVAGLRVTRAPDGQARIDADLAAVSLVPAAEAKAARGAPGGPGRRPGARPGGARR